jgi:D-alanyl-D-alanine carboxypeptidase (penicillin-binding protein 5/6)
MGDGRLHRRVLAGLLIAGVAVLATAAAVPAGAAAPAPSLTPWPTVGEGAVAVGSGPVVAGPGQLARPIASVAKVMTAYLVLQAHPLAPGQPGPTLVVGSGDVAATAVDRAQDQSVVAVAAGERLTERQALEGLLLPSGNNIAQLLAVWDAGSRTAFVARMNAAAVVLGADHTRYTDPSGFDAGTVSTAADQVVVIRRAMANPAFAAIVAMPRASLPVAGTVTSTDHLLGTDGFLGGKTGSDAAAGGCFVFADQRVVAGRSVVIYGAVLGQPGPLLVTNGLVAARSLADEYTLLEQVRSGLEIGRDQPAGQAAYPPSRSLTSVKPRAASRLAAIDER